MNATERDLRDCGKTVMDLLELNKKLAPTRITVYRVPKRGWRAFRVNPEHNTPTCTTCWFGPGVLIDWFDHTDAKVAEFMEVVKE